MCHSLNTHDNTRLHSSRMHTARLLPVPPSMHCTGGGGSAQRGVWFWGCVYPSMQWDRPPSLWTESQKSVKTKPCPNFVAGGNKCIPKGCVLSSCADIRDSPIATRYISVLNKFEQACRLDHQITLGITRRGGSSSDQAWTGLQSWPPYFTSRVWGQRPGFVRRSAQ